MLSEEEIESIRLAFNLYDLDRSGEIDKYEMKAALQSMGQNVSDAEVEELMTAVDENASGGVSFVEFMKMVYFQKELALSRDAEADLLDAFCAMGGNADKTGHVERSVLERTIKGPFVRLVCFCLSRSFCFFLFFFSFLFEVGAGVGCAPIKSNIPHSFALLCFFFLGIFFL